MIPLRDENPYYHDEETQREILSKKIATLPGACPCPINRFPQNPRTFESDHPPRSKHHIFTGLRISPPPLILLVHAEFPKPGDQDILAVYYGSLHDFQEGFGELNGFGLREAESVMDGVNDVGFGKGHGGDPF